MDRIVIEQLLTGMSGSGWLSFTPFPVRECCTPGVWSPSPRGPLLPQLVTCAHMEEGKRGAWPSSLRAHPFFFHSTGQNLATWLYLALKKSGFVAFIPGGHESNRLGILTLWKKGRTDTGSQLAI